MDKNPAKTFPAQFHINCRIKFAAQFVKWEYISALFLKSYEVFDWSCFTSCLIVVMFSLVNLLYPVWLASVFQQRARQIGGFLTARTKYMTGAPPANVEVKPPQTQNCPGAHTGAENARKPTFWPSQGFLTKWFLSNFSFLFQVHDAGGSRDWRSNVRGDDETSVISFWMRQHKTRVGRGPEVKKVTIPIFNLQNLKFPEISFLSTICISCRLLVHIFYEPIRACFDQDG